MKTLRLRVRGRGTWQQHLLQPAQRVYYQGPMEVLTNTTIADQTHEILAGLGVPASAYTDGSLPVTTPITGEVVARKAAG